MTEYRRQIFLKGAIAAVIGVSLVLGVAYLPLQASSSTTAVFQSNSATSTTQYSSSASLTTVTLPSTSSGATFSVESSTTGTSTFSISSTASSSTTNTTISSSTTNTELANFGRNITTLTVGLAPYGIAYDPISQDTFVAVSGNNSVAIIDNTSRIIGQINLGEQVDFLGFDPANGYLYAYLTGNNSISVINPSLKSVVASIGVGAGPGWVTFDPASSTMYVVNRQSNSISVISNATLVKTISVSGLPFAAAYNPTDQNMYVTSNFGLVFVINGTTNSLIRSIEVGGASSDLLGIAYSPLDHYMYVTSYSDNRVYILNSTSVLAHINGFSSPIGIAFDTNDTFAFYVANSGNDTVSAWGFGNTTSIVHVVSDPREIVFEPGINSIAETNYGNSTVSIISA